jgi:hypothetical protein
MSEQSAHAPLLPVHPYRPDGGFDLTGVMFLFTSLMLTGAVLGYVAHFVNDLFWLILVFPLLIGLFVGAVGVRIVKSARIRNPMVGAAAGLAGGLFAMLCTHYFDYKQFADQAIAANPDVAQVIALSPEEKEEVIRSSDEPDELRAFFAAFDSFSGYMNLSAREGVSISNHGGKGINLGYYGTWIYWIVEVLVVAGITLAMVRGETKNPYCVHCGQWKTPSTLGSFGDPAGALQALGRGDLAGLVAAKPTAILNDTVLYAHGCATCAGAQTTADYKFVRFVATKDGKTQEQPLTHVSWPGATLVPVKDLFKEPAVAQPEVATQG